jgi:RimJ/RimL family protein N-acetyltransferase
MTPWTIPLTPEMTRAAARVQAALPRIVTDRLVLRAPVLADFAAYATILTSDRAAHVGGPLTMDEAWDDFCRLTAIWVLRGHGLWTVEAQGRLVGFVLIGLEPGDLEPELGWFLTADAEGQGYATEAARAAREHGFATLGLTTLASYIAPENTASTRVAERLGARADGAVDGSTVWRHGSAA